MKNKVFNFNSNFQKVTGVQKVLLDIHHAIKDEYESKIVGIEKYEDINPSYHIIKQEYIRWTNPFIFYKSIVFVHERKYLILFYLLNYFFFQRIKIVYVHHNIFCNHRRLTILPKTIVSISDRCTENLVNYFGADAKNIHKIYNCVRYEGNVHKDILQNEFINVLYPGRINKQKQQLEIVRNLKGKLDKRIKIKFIGDGPYMNELKELVVGDEQFEVMGFRNDVIDLILKSDYVMLYSAHEGLSIALIEATMAGVPIICSDVGGNPEICIDKENGWVINSWSKLINTLNNLPYIDSEDYQKMCVNSRTIYERNFTFGAFKREYVELLNKLK